MRKATDNLIDDHLLIGEVMDVMEQITTMENPDVEHLEYILTFIREFADGCHHAKEEDLLFPRLIEKGMPGKQGPIGVMLMEHVQGRSYVKGMADNIVLYKAGEKDALKNIYLNMNGYVGLLRDHINKETNILFRMADNFLTGEEQTQLLRLFDQSEALSPGYKRKQEFLERIKEFTTVSH